MRRRSLLLKNSKFLCSDNGMKSCQSICINNFGGGSSAKTKLVHICYWVSHARNSFFGTQLQVNFVRIIIFQAKGADILARYPTCHECTARENVMKTASLGSLYWSVLCSSMHHGKTTQHPKAAEWLFGQTVLQVVQRRLNIHHMNQYSKWAGFKSVYRTGTSFCSWISYGHLSIYAIAVYPVTFFRRYALVPSPLQNLAPELRKICCGRSQEIPFSWKCNWSK
jgi:hypothetical protein